jgi:two-component system, sensor histidine kinase and response regulator
MSISARPRTPTGFLYFARAAGAAVILVSGLVIAGWGLDIEAFRIPRLTSMNPGGTALAFLLAGISLWIQSAPSSRRLHALAMACAGGVVLLALLRLGGYLLAWDGGPDQMLFRAKLDLEGLRTGHPNRMASNTATALLLVGLGPLILDAKSWGAVVAVQSLALSTAFIALLVIIGHTYSALSLAGIEQSIPMALIAAVLFALMSGGILCARPDRGVMAVLSSAGAGGVMAQRLLPAVILIPPVVGWVCWLGRQEGIPVRVLGLSLFVLANIVIFTALIWWNAASLDRMDGERRRAERRLGVQYTATRVLAESPRLDDAVPRMLQAICESLGWDVGVIWWVDPQAHVLVCGDLWHSPSLRAAEYAALCRGSTFAPGIGLPGRVWASGQPAWIPDLTKDSNFPRAPVAARAGLHGAVSFPTVVGSDILGVMEVASGEIQEPDEELLGTLAAIGSQIGQFVKRKQAEESVLRERYLVDTLMDTVPDTIYFKDAEGRFIRVNRAQAKHLGLSDPAEAAGKTDLDFFTEEHARQAWDDERAVMETDHPVIGKEEKETWDGGRVTWVSTTKLALRDKDGRIVGTFGISRDITAGKQAEEALRQQEERFRSLIEATVAIVWNTPASGEFETEQPGWTAYTGQTFDQCKGWGWLDAVHPDDRPNTAQSWSAAIASPSLYQVEHRLRRHDGEYRYMLVRAVPILAKGGGIREWIGVHGCDPKKR